MHIFIVLWILKLKIGCKTTVIDFRLSRHPSRHSPWHGGQRDPLRAQLAISLPSHSLAGIKKSAGKCIASVSHRTAWLLPLQPLGAEIASLVRHPTVTVPRSSGLHQLKHLFLRVSCLFVEFNLYSSLNKRLFIPGRAANAGGWGCRYLPWDSSSGHQHKVPGGDALAHGHLLLHPWQALSSLLNLQVQGIGREEKAEKVERSLLNVI